jgi:hypothetical protein
MIPLIGINFLTENVRDILRSSLESLALKINSTEELLGENLPCSTERTISLGTTKIPTILDQQEMQIDIINLP